MPVLTRQQQRRFFVRLQRHVPLSVALRLRQGLPFGVQQLHIDTGLRRAVFQALGKDIQPVVVAVRGYADIAEGEQRRGVAIAVAARLVHHRDIDARLLQRLDIRQRQQQFFARIARRVKVKTAGVDQIGHLQQLVRLPVAQGIAVFPLADEGGERFRFDAEKIDVDVIDIQRHHRQSGHHFPRQQRAAAGKADARGDIAGGNGFFNAAV